MLTTKQLETKIVSGLVSHLSKAGFVLASTIEPDDDCTVRFRSVAGVHHWVRLIPGNGRDIISDWGTPPDESDGWEAAVLAYVDAPIVA